MGSPKAVPVPCISSTLTSEAATLLHASASLTTACWLGPLGAVKLLLRAVPRMMAAGSSTEPATPSEAGKGLQDVHYARLAAHVAISSSIKRLARRQRACLPC